MKQKTVFVCQECGSQSPKWLGRCGDCGAWNSFVEERPQDASAATSAHRYALAGTAGSARLYADIEIEQHARLTTGIDELDRVLGGGIVPGSLVLLGGEPGIGKSTLLLQAAAIVARTIGPVLYSSGEESEHQIKLRGERLAVGNAPLYLLAETCLERILEEIARITPALVIVDSVQTIFSMKFQSAPGSIGQVREAATQLLFTAKGQNIPTFLVGHVTKDGSLAGPKALEHVVDTVLYFEGERHHSHRVVRAVKNRFGAVSELGVFEMTSTGLRPVPNPSKMFLAERPSNAPGSAVLCSVEGSRPILVEVQALVSSSTYGTARRMASGIDQQRLSLLLAVLEKRAGLNLIGDDVFVNIAGGMTVDEPAADLGVLAAIASSVRNRVIPAATAMFGEVGLAGEVRGISQASLRVREAAQMGFRRCIMPEANIDPAARLKPSSLDEARDDPERVEGSRSETSRDEDGDCELVGVRTVGEALDALLV
ncbi:MAG: DNA repair protein RadA [Acidobacteria bacterium 13_1_40CM_2_64_6]|nr:MAG: DNA repair protein RadA [Acidobacteria bacterium 13_1_40CM_65_14]OLC83132.1 MAG: DNA repair protein RadA [Acidobacteria bacterium 13_1_40CM_4_65_8]OLD56667.1 MAG: DNA repair protein RadA [Acidobacteria bacterium 13_1_40CM_2_64_6]OLE81032.1 MAG: DNA repair protein RadA [Acidobacteria bacterium 13_1_20CM_2_65_9]